MPKLALTLVVLATLSTTLVAQQDRQLIVVRSYQIKTADKAELFDSMMESAVKVLDDHGVSPVGVFKLAKPEGEYPHKRVTIAAYDGIEKLLSQGEAFQGGGNGFWNASQDYLQLEPNEKAFDRIDSMMLHAFTGMPKLEVPGESKEGRLFELRTYESYSELTALIKVKMFNEGEIELFEKVGLPAVFYGSAVAGGNLPQLTYMVVHDSPQAQKEGWQRFIKSPEWAALQKAEPYAGRKLVSKITKTMLVATDYSQIK